MSPFPPITPAYPWVRARSEGTAPASPKVTKRPTPRAPYPWAPKRSETATSAFSTSSPSKVTLDPGKPPHEPAKPAEVFPELELPDVILELPDLPPLELPTLPPLALPDVPTFLRPEPTAEALFLAERLRSALAKHTQTGENTLSLSPGEKVVDLERFVTTTESLLLTSSGRMLEVVTARVLRFLEAVEGAYVTP